MLPSRLRLPYSQSRPLSRFGHQHKTPYFEFTQRPFPQHQWLLVVPKKTLKLATARNRHKRLISEALLFFLPKMKTTTQLKIRLLKPFPSDTLEMAKQLLEEGLKQISVL